MQRERIWRGPARRPALWKAAVLLALLISPAVACSDGSTSDAILGANPTIVELCRAPLPPLTQLPLTESAFVSADDGLDTVTILAENGNLSSAELAFNLSVHNLTHDVDGPLRQLDEALATRLCSETIVLEEQLYGRGDPTVVAAKARAIRDLLGAAREALANAGALAAD